MTEVFISRSGADATFAALIGTILETAGYTVILQDWDFRNNNFIDRMHAALASGARVVALLSQEYLASEHCAAEWQNVLAHDPLNRQSRLVVFRVDNCSPKGLLAGIAFWDLSKIRDNRELVQSIVLEALATKPDRISSHLIYWRSPRTIQHAKLLSTRWLLKRNTVLAEIDAAMSKEQRAVVQGNGGEGKSSIAVDYGRENTDMFSGIWWIDAMSEDSIVESLAALGKLFFAPVDPPNPLADAQRAVRFIDEAGFAKPWLFIFDDVRDQLNLDDWIPKSARILATSRSRAFSSHYLTIALPELSEEEAYALVTHESGRSIDFAEFQLLLENLGTLPLALAHAAAALRNNRALSLQSYRERLVDHLARLPPSVNYPKSVAATFNEAFLEVEKEVPGSRGILIVAGFFRSSSIPARLYDVGPLTSHSAEWWDAAIGALDRNSLIDYDPDTQSFSIHPLVQTISRQQPDSARLIEAWLEDASRAARWKAMTTTESWLSFILNSYSVSDRSEAPRCEALLRLLVNNAMILNEHGLGLYQIAEEFLEQAASFVDQISIQDAGLAVNFWTSALSYKLVESSVAIRKLTDLVDRNLEQSEAVVAACVSLSDMYRDLQRTDDALRLAEAAMHHIARLEDSKNRQEWAVSVWTKIGYLQQALGDIDSALVWHQRAAEATWQNKLSLESAAYAIRGYGAALYEAGRLRDEVSLYERLFASQSPPIQPTDLATILTQGQSLNSLVFRYASGLFQSDQFEKAVEWLEAIADNRPFIASKNDHETLYWLHAREILAIIYQRIGQPDKAIEAAHKACQLADAVYGEGSEEAIKMRQQMTVLIRSARTIAADSTSTTTALDVINIAFWLMILAGLFWYYLS
jgi:tetratricopeptide (TPR) repeat protein